MKQYNEQFDAYYDDETNRWLEDKCDDPECEYCSDRPEYPPNYRAGDRVLVIPLKREATIIRQILHYDGPECFYGNVELEFDDGSKGLANGWQCKKVDPI